MSEDFNDFLRNNINEKKIQEMKIEKRKEEHRHQLNNLYNTISEWLQETERMGLVMITQYKMDNQDITYLELQFGDDKVSIIPLHKDYSNDSLAQVRMSHVKNSYHKETFFTCEDGKWSISEKTLIGFSQREFLDEEKFTNLLRKQLA